MLFDRIAGFTGYCISFGLLVACLAGSCRIEPYRDGKAVYEANCANCHQSDGRGLGALIPPLAGADYLARNQPVIPCLLRRGANAQDTVVVNGQAYSGQMPAMPGLSAIDLANVINYINNAWGNQYGTVRLETVRKALEDCGL
jgi:mono/diheme cytochrome c family protein